MASKKQVPGTSKPAKRKSKAKPKQDLIAIRAYARHRGCTAAAVRRAINSSRLHDSVVTNERGQAKITSIKRADDEWLANTRNPRMPTKPPEPDPHAEDDLISLNEARRRREIERWRQDKIKAEADELDLAHKKGELILVAEARAAVIDSFAIVRTRILGVPTRCRQQLADLSDADLDVMNDLIYEALEELADG